MESFTITRADIDTSYTLEPTNGPEIRLIIGPSDAPYAVSFLSVTAALRFVHNITKVGGKVRRDY